MAAVLWIDFDDVFAYAAMHASPTGIQRLAYETACALHQAQGGEGRVRFVIHGPAGSFCEVPWSEVQRLFAAAGPRVVDRAAPQGLRPSPPGRLRRLRLRLTGLLDPARVRRLEPLMAALAMVVRGLRAIPPALRRAAPSLRGDASSQGRGIAVQPARGDVLLALASPWNAPDYATRIAELRARNGVRFAVLFYDAIPLRYRQWCEPSVQQNFTSWFRGIAPLCDHPFAISHSTCRDIEACARQMGLLLPAPVVQVPVGSGFTGDGVGTAAAAAGAELGRLPASLRDHLARSGDYVLFVSTIEARKNHLLLLRVWLRLLAELPGAAVPRLVFAGRIGWLVADLMYQIGNTNSLDGHLLVVEGPDDATLAALYRGCLFTVYPSFYEGWGLPVVESLAFGKPCIAANTASLPEAGGDLARYFDPDNLHDAYRVLRATLDDRAGLADWQARITREFRAVPWSATAAVILNTVQAPRAA